MLRVITEPIIFETVKRINHEALENVSTDNLNSTTLDKSIRQTIPPSSKDLIIAEPQFVKHFVIVPDNILINRTLDRRSTQRRVYHSVKLSSTW